MLPEEVGRAAGGGGGEISAVDVTLLLHGPLPEALEVTTHHWPAPGFSATPGAMEHVPVPLAQPACAAVYIVRMRPPELSSTQSRYCVAVATAFQVKVGVAVAMLPEGATSVAAPGGGARSTVNVSALWGRPPGVGEKTVTDAVPAVAMSPAVIAACNWVLLTNVVTRAPLFHCTTDPLTKFVPFTVRVKAAAPAVALPGVSEAIVGTGLGARLMVKVSALELPPPGAGVNTRTEAVPAVAMSAAVIVA